MKKTQHKIIFVFILFIIIFPLIYSVFKKRDSSSLYFPGYLPSGYEVQKTDNEIIMSDNLGLGIKKTFKNNEQILTITTFKQNYDVEKACQSFPSEKFSNISLSTSEDQKICSYESKDGEKMIKQHYLVKNNQLIRIVESANEFLPFNEIEQIVKSLKLIKYK